MDISSAKWFSEIVMDLNDHLEKNSTVYNSLDFSTHQSVSTLEENLQQSLSSESNTSYPTLNPKSNMNINTTTFGNDSSIDICQTGFERPTKQLKTSSWTSIKPENVMPKASSSSPSHLSFVNSGSPATNPPQFFVCHSIKPKDEVVSYGEVSLPSLNPKDSNTNYHAPRSGQGTKVAITMSKTPSQAQDHIMAERKRREKLSQRFIALSAIVPGLKKMDKASVLEDATKYLKQLQERVKMLEEQTNKKKTVESFVFVKKSQVSTDDDSSSSDENFDGHSEALPEIEARVSGKDVLIRMHCEKHRGLLPRILSEIENLHLTVVNSSVLPFGNYFIDITVVAQMDAEFCVTPKHLLRSLRSAFPEFKEQAQPSS